MLLYTFYLNTQILSAIVFLVPFGLLSQLLLHQQTTASVVSYRPHGIVDVLWIGNDGKLELLGDVSDVTCNWPHNFVYNMLCARDRSFTAFSPRKLLSVYSLKLAHCKMIVLPQSVTAQESWVDAIRHLLISFSLTGCTSWQLASSRVSVLGLVLLQQLGL